MNVASTPDSLKKLTVSQLKALCKERHISGYSKLTKDAIIQKLANHSISTQEATKSTELVTNKRSSENISISPAVSLAKIDVPMVEANREPLPVLSKASSCRIAASSIPQAVPSFSALTSSSTTGSNDTSTSQGDTNVLPPTLASPLSRTSNVARIISSHERKEITKDAARGQMSKLAKGRFRKLVPSLIPNSQRQNTPFTTKHHPAIGCQQIDEDEYTQNFLSKIINLGNITSESLRANFDHGQRSILLRFLLTKFYFHVSIGFDLPSEWKAFVISDVQPVIPGEIWKISLQSGDKYYILEHTCEVITHIRQEDSNTVEDVLARDLERFRSDWSAYISEKILGEHGIRAFPKLDDSLRWKNHEEYEKGISRHWLRRIHQESSLGIYKKIVAERYIFACLMSNSISGTWMSAIEMSQEFNGLPEKIIPRKRKSPRLEMFLPEHHHVESVDFISSKRKPLHPALAIVQAPAREYYILRHNGMQVGCEEEGVGEVWMELLGCTHDGVEIQTLS